ncbi:EF hand domain-containing protein [Roseovarius halotolerans]|uniref:EF hand n=1 Tax=Roseovarius halotolerans TaxID=505353 RepID=A0A1X6Z0S1_9RHOB|nr:calcium-binding protein [Roseovarius halotolerans]RKT32489.1 EF hand domain-containing protein [Roseovarius halotolerans]SLN36591.1 EF hand [Roseovarius halotolerans]
MFKTTTAATFALALALPGAALANMADMDADGDGAVTMSEFQQAYPDAEAGTFSAVDTNADGSLTEEELTAAMEAGKLPEKSGG